MNLFFIVSKTKKDQFDQTGQKSYDHNTKCMYETVVFNDVNESQNAQ